MEVRELLRVFPLGVAVSEMQTNHQALPPRGATIVFPWRTVEQLKRELAIGGQGGQAFPPSKGRPASGRPPAKQPIPDRGGRP